MEKRPLNGCNGSSNIILLILLHFNSHFLRESGLASLHNFLLSTVREENIWGQVVQAFYRLEVFPVIRPIVSEHQRQHRALIQPGNLPTGHTFSWSTGRPMKAGAKLPLYQLSILFYCCNHISLLVVWWCYVTHAKASENNQHMPHQFSCRVFCGGLDWAGFNVPPNTL